MKNELFIAAAGAGKTTMFVKETLLCKESVLITTFTEENEREIKEKYRKLNKCILRVSRSVFTDK